MSGVNMSLATGPCIERPCVHLARRASSDLIVALASSG